MEALTKILEAIDGVVWGVPLIVLIMGTGIYLTIRLGLLQFRKLGKALKYMVKNEELRCALYSDGSDYRYRKYRRCCDCRYGGRPGSTVLDDSCSMSRYGNEVFRRTARC